MDKYFALTFIAGAVMMLVCLYLTGALHLVK